MGPVISAAQQERVLGFLERAVEAKATVVTGGGTVGERGFFVAPTIVADVTQDAEIVQREVFGPVVTVQRFSSDEEALELANGVRYGLAASVFSKDVGRALGAARKLAFGTVWINEHLFPLTSEMPHGGFKQSGYGKDMSLYSMEEYTRLKHVVAKLLLGRRKRSDVEKKAFSGKIVVLGFGSIGSGLLPLLFDHFEIRASRSSPRTTGTSRSRRSTGSSTGSSRSPRRTTPGSWRRTWRRATSSST